MGTAIILVIVGIGATYLGYKIIDNRKKYEFHNRTDGGVVKFKNWQATKTHSIIIGVGKAIYIMGIIIVFIGVLIIMWEFR